jgi:hypothetical protein
LMYIPLFWRNLCLHSEERGYPEDDVSRFLQNLVPGTWCQSPEFLCALYFILSAVKGSRWDSIVGLAVGWMTNGSEFKSGWGTNFLHPSLLCTGYWGLFSWG